MAYEWKDAITPVVTIASVWIGARLALGNDNRKKVMELETARLERLAVECDSYYIVSAALVSDTI